LIEIGSKTTEKNSAQTNRQTDRLNVTHVMNYTVAAHLQPHIYIY